MDFALISFRKDLARWRQDYAAVLIWIAIPLLIGGLITMMMGGGAQPHGILLLVDEDETFLSEAVVSAYSAGELGELITVEKTDYDDGLQRVNDGEASGLLVIPDGFMAALFESTPVTLTLKTNPSQTILPGIMQDVTEILLDAGFYVHQLFGEEIETITAMTEDPSSETVAELAVTINDKIEAVAPNLFPPVIEVEIVEPPPAEPTPPLALLFLPGIILMAVMFSANGLAGDYWKERDDGTLRRLVFAPAQISGFVVGKALAAAVVISAVAGVALVLGFIYHEIPWTRLPPSMLWIAVAGIALFAWFAALQTLFKTRKAASIVSGALLFPLLMAGGSFFPMAVMPGWIAAIGRVSPNGFVADRLTAEITSASAWAIDATSWLGVILAGLTGIAVCAWRLRSGFARA